jgi:hypothetical protein
MATLADYETALNACVASPTPANAAAVTAIHAVLPQVTTSLGGSMTRPDLPEWVANLAKQFGAEAIAAAAVDEGPRVLYGRPSYGDGR